MITIILGVFVGGIVLTLLYMILRPILAVLVLSFLLRAPRRVPPSNDHVKQKGREQ